MKIVSKNIADLTPSEIKQCDSLNKRDKGAMQDEFRYYRQFKPEVANCVLAKDGDKVLGWALIFPEYDKKRTAYFYVRHSERRKGIGTKLLLVAQQFQKKPYVCPHDDLSGKFFKATRSFLTIKRGDYGRRYLHGV